MDIVVYIFMSRCFNPKCPNFWLNLFKTRSQDRIFFHVWLHQHILNIKTRNKFTQAVTSIPYAADPSIQIHLVQASRAWEAFHSFCKQLDCLAKMRAAWHASWHSHTYNITSALVTVSVWLPMSAIPPTFKWDTGLAKIALLGILVQPPLHALVAEVILTLVAGVPVGPCIWHVCT